MTRLPPPVLPAPVVREVGQGIRVTTVTTGWVKVRAAHREFAGPDSLAMPALLVDRRWTPWMPVNVFLVQHPDRTVLVDTGETADRPPGYFSGAAFAQERFYRRYLRFHVPPEADPVRQLGALGVRPADVDTVVLTHLHSDHTGNLRSFDRAEVLLGPGGLGRYPGGTHDRLPADRTREVSTVDEPVGPWPSSLPLTPDGAVRVVPLPGHTPGHQGLLVRAERTVVIAGDAAFDGDQIRGGPSPGIATDRAANRRTQTELARFVSTGGELLLSHSAEPVLDG